MSKIKVWPSVYGNNFRVVKKSLSSIYNTQGWKQNKAKQIMILKVEDCQTSL